MNFYEYTQNNSGGFFTVNDELCNRIIIESDNIKNATKKAESLGIYFDGVRDNIDCECCGDRWYKNPSILDIDKINKGYEVSISNNWNESHSILKWIKKYSMYKIIKFPELINNQYKGKIGFDVIESYLQFISDRYGCTTPDCRLYYNNGDIKEFYSERVNI